jgi:hypothetical protein
MITRSRALHTINHPQDYYHCGQVPAVLYKRNILSITWSLYWCTL